MKKLSLYVFLILLISFSFANKTFSKIKSLTIFEAEDLIINKIDLRSFNSSLGQRVKFHKWKTLSDFIQNDEEFKHATILKRKYEGRRTIEIVIKTSDWKYIFTIASFGTNIDENGRFNMAQIHYEDISDTGRYHSEIRYWFRENNQTKLWNAYMHQIYLPEEEKTRGLRRMLKGNILTFWCRTDFYPPNAYLYIDYDRKIIFHDDDNYVYKIKSDNSDKIEGQLIWHYSKDITGNMTLDKKNKKISTKLYSKKRKKNYLFQGDCEHIAK
jgi:hypothetical protein|tara:strand:- start:31 stop:840 length:810 start_codon:yes stop_codon:yes gene_type:complete